MRKSYFLVGNLIIVSLKEKFFVLFQFNRDLCLEHFNVAVGALMNRKEYDGTFMFGLKLYSNKSNFHKIYLYTYIE